MEALTSIRPKQGVHSLLGNASLLRSHCYLDGRWIPADDGGLQPVHNPATGEWIGSVPSAGVPEAHRAIVAAQRAFAGWRERTPDSRAAVMRKWAEHMREASEDLAIIMTMEQGKPLVEARGEVAYATSFLDWFAEEGRRAYGETIPSHKPQRKLLTVRQPIGVAAAITPWNFPSAMITRKAGAALAAGCPMIVRPADETPFSALALAVLAERAGVPPGVFSVITGPARAVAGVLTESAAVRALSFTGSTEVGRILLKQSAETIKKVSLELGGHAPFIVFDDVDIERAAALAVQAKFTTSGQDCLAANRILVQRRSYDRFLQAFAVLASQLKVGNGMEAGVEIGPLISQSALVHCEDQIADALAHGATLQTGGRRHEAGPLFLTPTVLGNANRQMAIWREETFGPVAALAPLTRKRRPLPSRTTRSTALPPMCAPTISGALCVWAMPWNTAWWPSTPQASPARRFLSAE